MVRRSYNLLVVGYYYKKNYGDELLLEVAQKLFCEKYHSKDIKIIIITFDYLNKYKFETDLYLY